MAGDIDLSSLTLDRLYRPKAKARLIPKQQEPFLKGPIPLDWLQRTGKLPGRAMQVGVALWYRAGIDRSHTVRLSGVLMARFGVDRHAKARALRALEAAGLVKLAKARGKSPTITLIPVRPR